MTPKDIRHLQWILEKIQFYNQGKVDLYNLVNDLDALYRSLEEVKESWSEIFFNQWLNLESVNSHIITNGLVEISDESTDLIRTSLERIILATEEVLRNDLLTNNSGSSSKATDLGNNWLMCPLCEETWKLQSSYGMVRCPGCQIKLHNPRYS
jgi:hypothetical protein